MPSAEDSDPILFFSLQGHTNWVYYAAFGPDGRLLASCGADGTIWLWGPGTGRRLQT